MDLAHLRRVHGYDSVKRIEPISVDGPCLESRFDFRTTRKIAGIATLTLDFSTSTRVFGLGYSFVSSASTLSAWICVCGYWLRLSTAF